MRLRAVALVAVPAAFAQLLPLALPRQPVHAAELLGYALRLEGGVEHDSNPARVETLTGVPSDRAIQPSPALRLVAGGDLAASLGPHLLALTAGVAGKRFMHESARPEDLAIAEGRLAASFRLVPGWGAALGVSYYDVYQRADTLGDARDFRALSPSLRLEHLRESVSFALTAGWRWFTFKPERAFDFHGPSLVLGYRQTLLAAPADPQLPAAVGAQWDLAASLSLEQRVFAVGRCPTLESCPGPDEAELRRDRFWAGQVDVTRTGAVLLGAGLLLGVNNSNSYGESLARLSGSARAVVLLPWQVSLAARAELVATRYREAVPVGHNAMTGMFVSIEDEGRSTLRLELVRPIPAGLEVGLRYTFYSETPGTGTLRFRRQLLLGYLAFTSARP
jgi:hypothetical protein